ncbi:methyltransferase domain-containing protein [Stieleria sp. TO1_6]|uniref:methyltransferase domain-containing protein n=1 Tax=Stieleria tagensis TaxID=2956795 RepID=UPI00209B1FA0|nr:methyltransferase domain-containing protein [Stieleria tagensis]MCO8120427.1 methyltransferase domain-containing protein [Stieleria tagensis]
MRQSHFESLRPVCPVCRQGNESYHRLQIAEIVKQSGDHLIEGLLHCSNANCQREYPIIDGIPLIIADIRAYLFDNAFQVFQRRDLSPLIESVLGDCCGQGSICDAVRQHLSCYAWGHYADLDPAEPDASGSKHPADQSMLGMLQQGLHLAESHWPSEGPIVDIGCSVGRSSFELAQQFNRPVLGIDLNFPMLRLAGEVLREGEVRYPRRRVGLVYDQREFSVSFEHHEQVDYWACDATALPFVSGTFSAATSMNVLDCNRSPLEFLSSLADVLQPGGSALIASPYDWSTSATAVEGWLGGHSQRGPDGGASEAMVRRLLTGDHSQSIPGLRLVAETDVPWRVRMHDRSEVGYTSHVLVVCKDG